MNRQQQEELAAVSSRFAVHGELLRIRLHGNGHIHDTYLASYRHRGARRRYVHQRINQRVFRDPPALMGNIQRVTRHLRQKLRQAGVEDPGRRSLTLVRADDGSSFFRDPDGNYWRTYDFIEGASIHDTVTSPRMAHEAARAFGRFQKLLLDLPPPRLHETIPGFHDTDLRYRQFLAALEQDRWNRARGAREQIRFARSCEPLIRVLPRLRKQGRLPERVTHNDTKINNVLLDAATGEMLCVIDLDTVMPGLSIHDFGDLMRTGSGTHREDERNLSKVRVELPLFEALAQGYLAETADFLTPTERRHLPFSGQLIAYELGLRFLTDHLEGDVYFKIRREGQNLDRCRAQFRLVESIRQHQERMVRLVEEISRRGPSDPVRDLGRHLNWGIGPAAADGSGPAGSTRNRGP